MIGYEGTLRAFYAFCDREGRAPSTRELAAVTGHHSVTTPFQHMQTAAGRGLVTHRPNRSPAFVPLTTAPGEQMARGLLRLIADRYPQLFAEFSEREKTPAEGASTGVRESAA